MERRAFLTANMALLAAMALPRLSLASSGNAVDNPANYNHRFAEFNGIRMHYVEAGKGPLVILLHGFPLLWYSWRNQIAPLAAAGYRVVVPDQRGYGQTSAPEAIPSYDITQLVGDVVGLMGALGETSAVVVGWDIGTLVASHCALLRPDLFRGVVLVSSPYSQRPPIPPTAIWKANFKDKVFYQDYFQEIGKADAEMARDPHLTMRSGLYSLSADVAPGDGWMTFFEPGETVLENVSDPYARKISNPKQLPAWLSETALDYYVAQFTASGFTPALNWYRNFDRNWQETSFLAGARIMQPSLFVAGVDDTALQWGKKTIDTLETTMPGLQKKAFIPKAAHMSPEEKPAEFNLILLEYLNHL